MGGHDKSTTYTGDLSASLKSCFLSSAFSDLTIHTKDQEFKVHRLVICGQSEYFSRLYQGDWMETTENAVHLEEDDPRAIEAMIHFMYGFEYDSSGSQHGRISPMLFNIRVYQIADKYVVPQLKQLAKEKFEIVLKACWQMDDFPTAIAEGYGCTPKEDRGLRDPLVKISHEHITQLLAKDDFQTALEETTGFAADLAQGLTRTVDKDPTLTKYRCPSCGNEWRLGIVNGGPMSRCPCCGSSNSWSKHIVRD
ncbi:hypothetical protein P170DRAFT_465392 [Aspergillus steynii IBT 23096]|uniref:BTB domain-containing protein n=1 Tax=Aspergillus steynii IBT 23096 TaxID=1392250 RepID=A0A2I2G4R1_9EURO|nr:uncharacterized protein P170DRAFT_465392 [Aspergillus steynii IBT 23096]PLB47857.1 hypothetical protein P170DRAFT_465392 [Aspergillus steynii IBT 23096]